MKKNRVVIVGGGISGLLTAYAFSKYKNVDVTVIEQNEPGGEFLLGGYKYVRRIDEFVDMLHDLDCVFSTYSVRGGILLRNKIIQYPSEFGELKKKEIQTIRKDFWNKTKGTVAGKNVTKAFSDPYSYRPVRAVRADWLELISKLIKRTKIHKAKFQNMDDNKVYTSNGDFEYDRLVLTIPVWEMQEKTNFYVPMGVASNLNLIKVLPTKDVNFKWDFIYTPYTPMGIIHRVSSDGHYYYAEYSEHCNKYELESALYSELNFLFPHGWSYEGEVAGLKGHLHPRAGKVSDITKNVRLIGRYAQWDQKQTIDVSLEEALFTAKRWFGAKNEILVH